MIVITDICSMILTLFCGLKRLLMENSHEDDQVIVQIPSMARLTI